MENQFNPTYYNTVDQIYHAEWTAKKLWRFKLLRRSIAHFWPDGHPTRLVHVAGTSGKGSTCAFLEAGFATVGVAGSFRSPHLFDYRERFTINGEYPAQDDITEIWETQLLPWIIDLAGEHESYAHSFHELGILMALCLFERHAVQWAAIETGIGGRYDQTSALDVEATILTNVGDDHEQILGTELWQRALDKSGITRQGKPMFTQEKSGSSYEIIQRICQSRNAPLMVLADADLENFRTELAEHLPPTQQKDAFLKSPYQQMNAALSLMVLRHLLPDINIREVLQRFVKVHFGGRFHEVEPNIYIDIAHNPQKIAALVGNLVERFPDRPKIFVVGVSGKRSPKAVLLPLLPIADAVIIAGASYKGQNPTAIYQELGEAAQNVRLFIMPEPREALHMAKSLRPENGIVVLTGSTYMIEQALNPDPYLRHLNRTFGWRTEDNQEIVGSFRFTLPGQV